jgi:hypothetical protein
MCFQSASNEVHFFDIDSNFAKGYDWYKSQMPLGRHNVRFPAKVLFTRNINFVGCTTQIERFLFGPYNTNSVMRHKISVLCKYPFTYICIKTQNYNFCVTWKYLKMSENAWKCLKMPENAQSQRKWFLPTEIGKFLIHVGRASENRFYSTVAKIRGTMASLIPANKKPWGEFLKLFYSPMYRKVSVYRKFCA